MRATITALLTHRPYPTIATTALIAGAAAAWFARHLGIMAMAAAALTAATYMTVAAAAWHAALRRKHLREAHRSAADTVAYLAADLAAGTDPARAVAAVEADWPREAESATERLAAAWDVAAELGAPAADLCRRLAADLREDEQTAARTRAQTSSIHATAALLTALPVAGVALGEAMGVGAVAFLLSNPAGIACLGAAMALQAAGIAWTRALVAAVAVEAA